MILYHGTSGVNAKIIEKEGFIPDQSYNWSITSKSGFVYLSTAYAPFYCMNAIKNNKESQGALIQCFVNRNDLYPDDDFVMYTLGFPTYTQEQLNMLDLKKYKKFYKESLQYLGNACAKPEDITI